MASYLPWFGKKREHLAWCEEMFAPLLSRQADDPELVKCAEAVRVAQIRALRAKRAQLRPSEPYRVAMENLKKEIEVWQALSIMEIVKGYRSGKLCGHRAAAVRDRAAHRN
jgi:hypothetical protein